MVIFISLRVLDIEQFNASNQWTKKGIALVPMRWHHEYAGYRSEQRTYITCFYLLQNILSRYTAQIAIHNGDGSVQVMLGAIEMGQGLNTKVAQVRN